MSAKVYGGHRMADGSLEGVTAVVDRLNDLVKEEARTRFRALVAANAAAVMDCAALGLPLRGATGERYDGNNPASWAYRLVLDRHAEAQRSELYEPTYDLSCRAAVSPSRRGGALLMLLSRRDAHAEMLRSIPGVVPYPYWDNADRPDGVTAYEWAQRRDDWHASADHCYLQVHLVGAHDLPVVGSLVDIHLAARSRLERATDIAQNMICAERSGPASDRDEAYRRAWESVQWLTTEDGRAAVNERALALVERLPEIGPDDMRKPLSASLPGGQEPRSV